MAYVPVPKDLNKIKTKVMFNLTKRQLISFGSGALLGVPMFLLAKPHMSVSAATLVMIFIMLPFFMVAMYEKNGQPLEKIMFHMIESKFIRPKVRPYQTDNFYNAINNLIALEREVKSIVNPTQTNKSRKKAHRRSHPKSQK